MSQFSAPTNPPPRVAIIGLGACLPDAPDVATFWENILKGHVAIGEVPPQRWSQDTYYDPERLHMDRTYSRIGGFIRYDPFDSRRFRLMPRSLPAIDAIQKFSLVAVAEALRHAKLAVFASDPVSADARAFNRERCAVILGNAMGGEAEDRTSLRVWLLEVLDGMRQSARSAGLSEHEAEKLCAATLEHYAPTKLPQVTEDSMPGELSNCIAGRITNVFDLQGPNFTCDAACASSFAALEAAVRGLQNRDFDVAIAGGADRSMDPPTFVKFCRIGALSAEHSAPFDERANGFVMGEGVGVAVLKRLEDAQADGDPILAVICGIGGSSDGRGKALTAPNPRGQKLAIERAWQQAGMPLETAGLFEAHGTGTPVGDAVEAEVLTSLLEQTPQAGDAVPMGSVKSMIGHLKSAAGAAALIKTTLALHHGIIPPSANFRRPKPGSPLTRGRLTVPTQAAAWPACSTPRRAGMSAFGFGGTNFHVVLEQAPTRSAGMSAAPPEVDAMKSHPAGPSPTARSAHTADIAAIASHVVGVFAEQTGYSLSELELNFAMEADLGIDSVKQAEIVSLLRSHYGIGDAAPVHLAELTTLQHIIDFVAAQAVQAEAPTEAGLVAEGFAQATAPAAAAPAPSVSSQATSGGVARLHANVRAGAGHYTVFAFGGDTKQAVLDQAQRLLQAGDQAACDAARARAASAPVRLAVVAQTLAEAQAAVAKSTSGSEKLLSARGIFASASFFGGGSAANPAGDAPGDIAFLFPGQGSQYLGMLQDLAEHYDIVRDTFAEADAALAEHLPAPLTSYVWPQTRDEAAEQTLRQTEYCQPAMLAADVALARLLQAHGVSPQRVAGHSLGEYAAAVVAGVLPFADALYAVSARGREMANVRVDDPGQMAMVAADAERVEAVLATIDGYVIAANKNCFTQTVIAGTTAAVGLAMAAFANEGIEARPIAVSHAFHSAIVAPAATPLMRVLSGLQVTAPSLPLSSNVNADYFPAERSAIIECMGQQLASPVQWIAQLQRMHQDGARVFIEVGPKRALTGFVRNVLAELPHVALACNHPKRPGPQGVAELLAALVAQGAPVRFASDCAASVEAPSAPVAQVTTVSTSTQSGASEAPAAPANSAANGTNSPPEPRAYTPTDDAVVISGVSVLLPGGHARNDWRDDAFAPLLRGDNCIEPIAADVRAQMLAKKIVRLEKQHGRFCSVERDEDVLQLAGTVGDVDTAAWGIDPALAEALDATSKLALAASIDALRDAGLPVCDHLRTTSTGTALKDRTGLPRAVGERTGVILASAFAGLDAILKDVAAAQDGRPFDRKWLLRVLPMGHAQVAEFVQAQGPSTLVNAACASGTQAIGMAADWIRLGRCDRVIVVTADDVAAPDSLPWIGAGFLAAGAATTEREVKNAALPFSAARNGMVIGSGASAFVVERQSSVAERGMVAIAEVVACEFANSAFHATRLDTKFIRKFLARTVAKVPGYDDETGPARLAPKLAFLSHETYTPARGGSAAAEVDSLRHVFGERATDVLIANTKGFTGHPMGASFEDVAAIKGLQRQQMPPIANLREPDPAFADLRFSRGDAASVDYVLRFAAGFGSQVAVAVYRRVATQEARLQDPERYAAWCAQVGLVTSDRFEVCHRRLQVAAASGAAIGDIGIASLKCMREVPAEAPQAMSAPQAQAPVHSDDVLASLVALFAEQTGYDPSELDADHAIEADLGIDSVKQAEVFAIVRERWQLDANAPVALAELSTLRKMADAVAKHAASKPAASLPAPAAQNTDGDTLLASAPVPASAPAPSPVVHAAPQGAEVTSGTNAGASNAQRSARALEELTALFSSHTGYEASELDPDHAIEADLGIDSVKQAEILAIVRERWQIAADAPLVLSELSTLRKMADAVSAQPATKQAAPAPTSSAPALAAEPVRAAEPTHASEPADEIDYLAEVTTLFAEQTGYDPAELDPDMSLEADLGIDSVKQAEVISSLRTQHGLPGGTELKLSELQTLRALATYLATQAPRAAASSPASGPQAPQVAPAAASPQPTAPKSSAQRAAIDGPLQRGSVIANAVALLPAAGPIAPSASPVIGWMSLAAPSDAESPMARSLQRSLDASPLTHSSPVEGATIVVWAPDAPGGAAPLATADALFRLARAWRTQGTAPKAVVVLTQGGALGFAVAQQGRTPAALAAGQAAAISGVVKALTLEWPEVTWRACDVDGLDPSAELDGAAAQALAGAIRAALVTSLAQWPHAESVLRMDDGIAHWAVPARLPATLTPKAQPLRANDLVVVTGGARGVTYALTHALAERRPLELIIFARTAPFATGEDADANADEAARKASAKVRLAENGERVTPAAVRRLLDRDQARREVGRNLAALRATGSRVHYVAGDVADPSAVAKVAEVVRASGKDVSLLLHGAGIEESRLLQDKQDGDFARIVAPKFDAMVALQAALSPARSVSMGSIAGRFGNAGQPDYAAANNALAGFARRQPGALLIAWSAWDDIGMATRGSTRRVLSQHGVQMLPLATGLAMGLALIESDATGEVVVAGALGALAKRELKLPPLFHSGSARPITTLTRRVDPACEPGLNDHRIDGVAVLPAVLGTELMLQAARFVSGRAVCRLRAVRFASPVKFHRDEALGVDIEVVRRTEEGLSLRLCTTFVGPGGRRQRRQHFEAEASFDTTLPAAVQPSPPAALLAPATKSLTRSQIYTRYFHGPLFQVLADAPLLGDHSVLAQSTPAQGTWGEALAPSEWQSRPHGREAAFQAAGLWEMAECQRMALPAGIDEIWVNAVDSACAAGHPVQIEVQRVAVGDAGCRFNIVQRALEQDGSLGPVLDVMHGYSTIVLAPLPAQHAIARESGHVPDLTDIDGLVAAELALADVEPLLDGDGSAVEAYLAPQERAAWAKLKMRKRRLDWLAGRLVAKRCMLQSWPVGAPRPAAADIVVGTGDLGEPTVWFAGAAGLPAAPRLSISHGGGVAMALCSWNARQRPGIDVQPVKRRDASFAKTYFTPSEQAAVAQAAARNGARPEVSWTVRWALKEAALKALGIGARVDFKELVASPVNSELGEAWQIEFFGEAEQALLAQGAEFASAHVAHRGGRVVVRVVLNSTEGRTIRPSRARAAS